jgi:hypothetical protein
MPNQASAIKINKEAIRDSEKATLFVNSHILDSRTPHRQISHLMKAGRNTREKPKLNEKTN